MFENKTLICKDCGNEFATAGEQEFYAERVSRTNRQMQECRMAERMPGKKWTERSYV